MRTALPLYEGDSVIHYPSKARPPVSSGRPAAPVASVWTAIGAAFEAFMGWLERHAANARYRELDAYLAQSNDLCDLERRIRSVERNNGGKFDSSF